MPTPIVGQAPPRGTPASLDLLCPVHPAAATPPASRHIFPTPKNSVRWLFDKPKERQFVPSAWLLYPPDATTDNVKFETDFIYKEYAQVNCVRQTIFKKES